MRDKFLSIMRKVELGPYPRVDFIVRQAREVVRRHSLVILIVVLALSGLVRFGVAAADPSIAGHAAVAAPGTYVISCLMEPRTGPSPAPCLTGNEIPVGTPLILLGHVTDSSGNLADSGREIFQDCLLNGGPAPSIHCDSGTGVWSNIQTVHFRSPEDIRIGYGSPSTAQTIGFRFRYLGSHSSGIAKGISNSMDVTWF